MPRVAGLISGNWGFPADEEFALEHGLAIIGFREIPSLDGAHDYDAVFKIVRASLPTAKPRAVGSSPGIPAGEHADRVARAPATRTFDQEQSSRCRMWLVCGSQNRRCRLVVNYSVKAAAMPL